MNEVHQLLESQSPVAVSKKLGIPYVAVYRLIQNRFPHFIRKGWIDDDIAFLTKHFDKSEEKIIEIAETIRKSPIAVIKKARDLGLFSRPWTQDEDTYLCEHHRDGTRQIALALGRTAPAIHKRKKLLGLI